MKIPDVISRILLLLTNRNASSEPFSSANKQIQRLLLISVVVKISSARLVAGIKEVPQIRHRCLNIQKLVKIGHCFPPKTRVYHQCNSKVN